jgi:hypothetical protein
MMHATNDSGAVRRCQNQRQDPIGSGDETVSWVQGKARINFTGGGAGRAW